MTKQPKKRTFLVINWEYPVGLCGTASPVQYAYFLTENDEVIKIKVKENEE